MKGMIAISSERRVLEGEVTASNGWASCFLLSLWEQGSALQGDVEGALTTTDPQNRLVRPVRPIERREDKLRAHIETQLGHYPLQLPNMGLLVHDPVWLRDRSK